MFAEFKTIDGNKIAIDPRQVAAIQDLDGSTIIFVGQFELRIDMAYDQVMKILIAANGQNIGR
jgi:hypothetical protein